MKVLIFEHAFKVQGHRLSYASLVAAGLSDHDVVIALPDVLSEESILDDYFEREKIHFYPAATPGSFLNYARDGIRWLRQMIRQTAPDHVLIPTADGMATLAGLGPSSFGNLPIDICLMTGRRPASELNSIGRFKNSIKWQCIRRGPWAHILLMDPRSWSELKADGRVLLAPDPVPDRPDVDRTGARAQLDLPTEGRLLVSAGNQDHRKGIDRLIAGFCATELTPDDRLLLIGRFSESIRSTLKQHSLAIEQQRILIRDQFISEDEFGAALVAADLVATPYRDTSRPSGVISRCLAWGIPILATDAGWLRWAIDRFGAGYPLDPTNPQTFADSIKSALEATSDFRRSPQAQQFAEFNSATAYQSMWRKLVDGGASDTIPQPRFLKHAGS